MHYQSHVSFLLLHLMQVPDEIQTVGSQPPAKKNANKQATGTVCHALGSGNRGLCQFGSPWPCIVDLHRSSNCQVRRHPLGKCSSHEEEDRLGIQKTHFLVHGIPASRAFTIVYAEIRLSRLAARQNAFSTSMKWSSKIVIIPLEACFG
jgi:hypothetical protein